MSDNLALTQVTEGQASKEASINTQSGQIDAAITEFLSVDLSSGSATISDTNYRRNFRFLLSGVATSGRTVTFPAIRRFVMIRSPLTSTDSVQLIVGSTTYDIAPGENVTLYTDGTTDGADFMVAPVAGQIPYDMPFFFGGQPGDGVILARVAVLRAFTLEASLPGAQFAVGTAPADGAGVITLKKNDSSTIGTLSYAITTGTVTPTFASDADFAAGDTFEIYAPTPQDSAWADVSMSFIARR